MTHKVGTRDRVVIPKTIQADRIKALRGIWSGEGTGTDALLAERRRERELEERKALGRGVGRL